MSSSPVVPQMHHVNLLVTDPSSSCDWYCQIFGYLKERDFIQDGRVTGVALRHPSGGVRLALRWSPRPLDIEASVAPIAWAVPTRTDLDALVLHLAECGVVGAIMQQATSGWNLSFSDPDGYTINVYSLDASEARS